MREFFPSPSNVRKSICHSSVMPVTNSNESKIVYPGLDHSYEVKDGVLRWEQTEGWVHPERSRSRKREQVVEGQSALWSNMAEW